MRRWRALLAATIGTEVVVAAWWLARGHGTAATLVAAAVLLFMVDSIVWLNSDGAARLGATVARRVLLQWLGAVAVGIQVVVGAWWLSRDRGSTTAALVALATTLLMLNILLWAAAGGAAALPRVPGHRASLARGLCAAAVGVQLFFATWWLINADHGNASIGVLAGLTLGINLSLWGGAGLLRLLDDWLTGRHPRPLAARLPEQPVTVAILIPAHNEEPVIRGSIASAARLLPLADIYVVSDASTDATEAIATETGANVLQLTENKGKAGALEAAIGHFGLTDRYEAVLFLDADSELDERYLANATEFLDDPAVAAVAGYATIMWRPAELTLTGQVIAAYRDRLYTLQQRLLKFGQAWPRLNVAYIAPGFASVYRSEALRTIDMNPPGLIIEDFNMTFQLHRRRVGRVSFSPRVRAAAQDPATVGDYVNQVRRWSLGFWQTIRFNGVWPSLFWLSLSLVILESLIASVALLAAVALAVTLALPGLTGGFVLGWAPYATVHAAIAGYVTLPMLALAVLGPDLLLTGVMAAIRKRPRYLLLGLAFPALRLVDAAVALWTIPLAWTTRSTGSWRSPVRR